MKEYTLVAQLGDDTGGDWSITAGISAKNGIEAGRRARLWGRFEAKELGARLLDAYAVDDDGITHD